MTTGTGTTVDDALTATIFTPFLVVFLLRARGVSGVVGLMIGLLILQIVVVHFFGIESKRKRLEELE